MLVHCVGLICHNHLSAILDFPLMNVHSVLFHNGKNDKNHNESSPLSLMKSYEEQSEI